MIEQIGAFRRDLSGSLGHGRQGRFDGFLADLLGDLLAPFGEQLGGVGAGGVGATTGRDDREQLMIGAPY